MWCNPGERKKLVSRNGLSNDRDGTPDKYTKLAIINMILKIKKKDEYNANINRIFSKEAYELKIPENKKFTRKYN